MSEFRGFKFLSTSVLEFKKTESDDGTKYNNFYLNSKAETIINENDINNLFESIYSKITLKIENYLRKGSSWIID